jgi:predicted phosphodiesterase
MPELPPALFDCLADVDLILHAGDLDDPAILDELRRMAPVQAVRGNIHLQAPWPNDQQLPLSLDLLIEGQRIVVTHGHLSLWYSFVEKLWLFVPDHHRHVNRALMKRVERWEGALFVNPGAVCPTRGEAASVARLRVTEGRVEAEVLRL